MVKILQAYNFAKQNTYSLNGEILSATLIDSNRIAISSADQFIEIYDIGNKQRLNESTYKDEPSAAGAAGDPGTTNDERSPTKYSLPTVSEVVNLIYCEAGKYMLTLEKENSGSPVHSNSTSISCTSSSNSNTVCSDDDTKMFVRIYANFSKFAESKLIDMPITIRIASMTTPKAPLIESIDVIELPLRSPPELIQCCQISGNIIVSSKERIYLYEYTQCVHENTQPRFSFIDFLPFKFFVNLNFVPLKLNLAENVIACMNNRYCVAFKVVDMLATDTTGERRGTAVDSGLTCFDNDYETVNGGVDVDVDEPVSSAESSIASKASAAPSTHSHNSYETDSLETTSSGGRVGVAVGGFPGRTPVDFNVARMVNSACGREFEVDLKSQWDQNENMKSDAMGGETQEIIITPTRASDIKIKLVNEAKAMNVQRISSCSGNMSCSYSDDTTVQYDVRKLLQICMKTSEPNGRVVDIIRCIDLKAIYQRTASEQGNDDVADEEYDMGNQQIPSAVTTFKHVNRRTLKSKRHQSCVGYALLVASSVDGYLYQFCAQGKWYNENEKPIAIYSFTAPVLRVHINDYVIYAITTESVETHTSRIGHKLFNNRFEYPTIGGLFPEESSPDVNAPIAVVGLSSFMHVQLVCVNRTNLVLISNSTSPGGGPFDANNKRRSGGGSAAVVEVKRNLAARFIAEAKAKHNLLRNGSAALQNVTNEWTLYSLEVPLVEHIIDDIEAIAASYRSASSTNFYDLMEEAHVMLRLSLTLQFERNSTERDQELRSKFVENCRKLADFSIRSKKKEVFLQATGFYTMCNVHLVEIYHNYLTNYIDGKDEAGTQIEAVQLVGLIYTIKLFLLNLGTDRLKSAFLHQLVTPYFTSQRPMEQIYQQVPLSLEFLNMFIKYSPLDIPQIMLSSPVVADAMSSELINYLKNSDKLTADDNLLLAVTACRMSNYLLAQEVIAKTSRRDLATALIKYKNVLFDDSTALFQKQRQQPNVHAKQATLKKSQMRRLATKQHKYASVSSATPAAQLIVSFSDFSEIILLPTENVESIEAISDVFIHALCIEHSITLETILQLFLNYIASHIGQKGYLTSQKVFVNILQVYYYDMFDVCSMNNPHELRSQTPPQLDDDYDEASSKAASITSERENESLANSIGAESNSVASSEERYNSSRHNRIVYDQLQEQSSPFKRNSNVSLTNNPDEQQHLFTASEGEVNLKGLKILFRMYMGRLKALSDLITDLQSADVEQQQSTKDDFPNLRMECIAYMLRHLHELRTQQINGGSGVGGMGQNYYPKSSFRAHGSDNVKKFIFVPFIPDYKLTGDEYERYMKSYIRPIPCLLERPQYLNRLPPFERGDFSYPKKDDGEFEVRFQGWHNELLTLTLKIQSLLATIKIDREIIEEFIAFIQKTPNLIGIDSFLVIVLPKNLAINYMLNFSPQYLWQYGKSSGFTPKHWESLLRKILGKQELLPNWKSHITEILNNLVTELTFEELLQCFPSEVVQNRTTESYTKEFAEHKIIYEHNQLIFDEHCSKTKQIADKQPKDENNDCYEIPRKHAPMDNIDENNVFELALRKAVAKQRSIALRSMIESTGTQLFDATSNPMYNL